jgi:hypothetical protein
MRRIPSWHRIPADIQAEILAAVGQRPLATADLWWELQTRIEAEDATGAVLHTSHAIVLHDPNGDVLVAVAAQQAERLAVALEDRG